MDLRPFLVAIAVNMKFQYQCNNLNCTLNESFIDSITNIFWYDDDDSRSGET
jgi:hypothetical protein